MTVEQIRKWVADLSRIGEDTLPYTEIDGKVLTPRDILREVEANTPLGQKLRVLLGDPPLKLSYNLLVKRFEERVKQGKALPIATIGGKILTPEQQLEEVKKGTRIGQQLLLAEAALIEELEKRRR